MAISRVKPTFIFHASLIALLSALAIGCGGPERKTYRGGNSYLPLLEGRVLKYEELRDGTTQNYTMSVQYAGGHVAKLLNQKQLITEP